MVARVKEITGGRGARVIFEAAAVGGIIFEYGALSMQPTPFPLFTALIKGYAFSLYLVGDHAQSGEADCGEEICLRPASGWTVPSEGRQEISVCADRGGLQISRVERTGGENCDYCSFMRTHNLNARCLLSFSYLVTRQLNRPSERRGPRHGLLVHPMQPLLTPWSVVPG